jgi:hypothetical protein
MALPTEVLDPAIWRDHGRQAWHGPGVLDLPPLDTWLYTVEPNAGGDPQVDVPQYHIITRASLGRSLPD